MTDREQLIKILDKSFAEQYEKRGLLTAPHTAEELLANGVVKVVRCKDCMFYKHTVIGDCMACVKYTSYKAPNDYCSCGKLKEMNNNA